MKHKNKAKPHTLFNPEGKKILTIGECLHPAMEITDEEDAKQYFAAYVNYMQERLAEEPNEDGLTAEQIVRINLGYLAEILNLKAERAEDPSPSDPSLRTD